MKFFSRTNTYKAGDNLTLNMNTMTAYSYKWYLLAYQLENGTMLLNTYNYSSTTVRHYYKTRSQLKALGFNIVEVEAPKGLQDLDSAVELYEGMIKGLEMAITKKGSRKSTNVDRLNLIETYKEKIDLISSILTKGQ